MSDRREHTDELTGADAGIGEAAVGSAESGASPLSEDLSGARELEEDPAHPEDVFPDAIERLAGAPVEDEATVTARPREWALR